MTSPRQPAIRNKQRVNSINQKPATRNQQPETSNQLNPIPRLPIILISIALIFLISSSMVHGQEWWQKWDHYPKVPRITAKEVKQLMLANEKIVFVYAGYEVDQVLCGSFYIPYTWVPPISDGSSVNLRFPKDYWIMCY